MVGARPQFIKAAPVSQAFAAAGIAEYLVHTGQHYDPEMSAVFFAELGIREPDINLSVGSGTHGAKTGAMLRGLEGAMMARNPDWVLVYGDTDSTLAGALAASKLGIPVAHVESGLRSFNRKMPEEINRTVTDVLSSLWFIPTETARANLAREGIQSDRVVYTGDVMFDSIRLFSQRAQSNSGVISELGLAKNSFVLATIHRAENTDDPKRLRVIIEGLRLVAEQKRVILPLHPRTRARLSSQPSVEIGGVELIRPVGFLDMLRLEAHAEVIATDSGGVQKEAFFHHVPCVTMRTETEWTELVDYGWNRLAPPVSSRRIAKAILTARGAKGKPVQPYGDGHAAEKIGQSLLAFAS